MQLQKKEKQAKKNIKRQVLFAHNVNIFLKESFLNKQIEELYKTPTTVLG